MGPGAHSPAACSVSSEELCRASSPSSSLTVSRPFIDALHAPSAAEAALQGSCDVVTECLPVDVAPDDPCYSVCSPTAAGMTPTLRSARDSLSRGPLFSSLAPLVTPSHSAKGSTVLPAERDGALPATLADVLHRELTHPIAAEAGPVTATPPKAVGAKPTSARRAKAKTPPRPSGDSPGAPAPAVECPARRPPTRTTPSSASKGLSIPAAGSTKSVSSRRTATTCSSVGSHSEAVSPACLPEGCSPVMQVSSGEELVSHATSPVCLEADCSAQLANLTLLVDAVLAQKPQSELSALLVAGGSDPCEGPQIDHPVVVQNGNSFAPGHSALDVLNAAVVKERGASELSLILAVMSDCAWVQDQPRQKPGQASAGVRKKEGCEGQASAGGHKKEGCEGQASAGLHKKEGCQGQASAGVREKEGCEGQASAGVHKKEGCEGQASAGVHKKEGCQGQASAGVRKKEGCEGQASAGVRKKEGCEGQAGAGVRKKEGCEGQAGAWVRKKEGCQGQASAGVREKEGCEGQASAGVRKKEGCEGQAGVGVRKKEGCEGQAGAGVRKKEGCQGQASAGVREKEGCEGQASAGVRKKEGCEGQAGAGVRKKEGCEGQVGAGVRKKEGCEGQVSAGVRKKEGCEGQASAGVREKEDSGGRAATPQGPTQPEPRAPSPEHSAGVGHAEAPDDEVAALRKRNQELLQQLQLHEARLQKETQRAREEAVSEYLAVQCRAPAPPVQHSVATSCDLLRRSACSTASTSRVPTASTLDAATSCHLEVTCGVIPQEIDVTQGAYPEPRALSHRDTASAVDERKGKWSKTKMTHLPLVADDEEDSDGPLCTQLVEAAARATCSERPMDTQCVEGTAEEDGGAPPLLTERVDAAVQRQEEEQEEEDCHREHPMRAHCAEAAPDDAEPVGAAQARGTRDVLMFSAGGRAGPFDAGKQEKVLQRLREREELRKARQPPAAQVAARPAPVERARPEAPPNAPLKPHATAKPPVTKPADDPIPRARPLVRPPSQGRARPSSQPPPPSGPSGSHGTGIPRANLQGVRNALKHVCLAGRVNERSR